MKELNLCEILKGHEGETFYSPLYGKCFLECVKETEILIGNTLHSIKLNQRGWFNSNGDCMLFPSKDQRDWNKWIEEQKSKGIKTWDELVKRQEFLTCYVDIDGCSTAGSNIEKSALALLKISQLIGTCYGGNMTEWEYPCVDKYIITPTLHIEKVNYKSFKSHIAFHTKEQAEEFLSYPENVQLLKDYFMV